MTCNQSLTAETVAGNWNNYNAQGLPILGNDNYMLLQLPAWYLQQQQQHLEVMAPKTGQKLDVK